MIKKTLIAAYTALLLSMVTSAYAQEVVGKIKVDGSVDLTRSGVTNTVVNSNTLLMLKDQLSTRSKSMATLMTSNQSDKMIVSGSSKVMVMGSSPLSVGLEKGGFGANAAKGETIKVESPNTSFTAYAMEKGGLAVATSVKQTSIVATEGKFRITDQSGVTKIVTANDLNALILGTNQQPKLTNVDLKSVLAANTSLVTGIIAAAAAIGIVITVVVLEVTKTAPVVIEPEVSPF